MSLGRCSFEKWGTWQQLQIWVFQQTLLWGVLRLKTPTICTFEAFILNKSKRSGRLQGIIIQDDKTSRFPSVVWYLCMYFLQFQSASVLSQTCIHQWFPQAELRPISSASRFLAVQSGKGLEPRSFSIRTWTLMHIHQMWISMDILSPRILLCHMWASMPFYPMLSIASSIHAWK